MEGESAGTGTNILPRVHIKNAEDHLQKKLFLVNRKSVKKKGERKGIARRQNLDYMVTESSRKK